MIKVALFYGPLFSDIMDEWNKLSEAVNVENIKKFNRLYAREERYRTGAPRV